MTIVSLNTASYLFSAVNCVLCSFFFFSPLPFSSLSHVFIATSLSCLNNKFLVFFQPFSSRNAAIFGCRMGRFILVVGEEKDVSWRCLPLYSYLSIWTFLHYSSVCSGEFVFILDSTKSGCFSVGKREECVKWVL